MPHLQELVKLHKDDPFVLIGVNTGDGEEAYREGLEKFGVTWLSAYQGDSTPIADKYAVAGYPTYLVIDAEGKVVHRGHSGKACDPVIADLLEKMKKKGAE